MGGAHCGGRRRVGEGAATGRQRGGAAMGRGGAAMGGVPRGAGAGAAGGRGGAGGGGGGGVGGENGEERRSE